MLDMIDQMVDFPLHLFSFCNGKKQKNA